MVRIDYDYGKCALVLYNMEGNARVDKSPKDSKMIPNIQRLIRACHTKGRPVIYASNVSVPEEYQTKYFRYWLQKRHLSGWGTKDTSEGGSGIKYIKEIRPTAKDLIVKKHVADMFIQTNADAVLRARGVEVLIFVGGSMEHGVDSAVRHSTFLGYMPVLVEDAINGNYDPVLGYEGKYLRYSMAIMKDIFCCEVRTTDYVVKKIMSG